MRGFQFFQNSSIHLIWQKILSLLFLKMALFKKKMYWNIVTLGFPGDPVVQNLLAMQETWVRRPRSEDPLEKKLQPNTLALRIPWTDVQSMGSQKN